MGETCIFHNDEGVSHISVIKKISGDTKYTKAAEECMRNCLCLFGDDGKGSAAYIYPYRVNDVYGKVYDEWANDQDFALYFALI